MDDQTAPNLPFRLVPAERTTAVVGDRSARARALADSFAERFRPTLPPPDPDAIPRAGRHVRCTAETHGQVYVGGETYHRDARARITVRSTGMPSGWSVRLSVVDVQVVAVSATNPGSRADPAVLRAHRQMAAPGAAIALGASLRNVFVGRPVQADTHSLFSSGGLVFVREASVVVPLSDDGADDQALQRNLVAAAQAALIGAKHPDLDARNRTVVEPTQPLRPIQRGHLRVIQ
jgi:hypothetical protein